MWKQSLSVMLTPFILISTLLFFGGVLAENGGGAGLQSPPYLVVLGVAQDGGTPQTGTREHKGWDDPDFRRSVVSLGLVDPVSGERWMLEATPDFPMQLQLLNQSPPVTESTTLSGIFLTHAHIGHYAGLMFLGHESMGAENIAVYAMPRMAEFLRTNGPWSQLIRYGNIATRPLEEQRSVRLNSRLAVTPFRVPHRQEFSEVVGYRIEGPARSALFIPDIDSWDEWDEEGMRIENLIGDVDVAYLDGTFFFDGEIPGRDMSEFPHPFIRTTMTRFNALSADEKAKVRFIHLNHTNPAMWEGTDARREILENGFRVAKEGEQFSF